MGTKEMLMILLGVSIFGWYIVRSSSNAILAVGRIQKGVKKVQNIL